MSKWEKVKIKDIGQVLTGNTPSTNKLEYYESNDIHFFKPNDLNDSIVQILEGSTNYVSEKARSSIRIVPKGSILVSCIGIIGKVGIVNKESSFNQQINAIIPDLLKVEPEYLAYALLSIKNILRNKANSAVVPIINKSQFLNTDISLPPLEIQKQIAQNLDTVSELLVLRKKQLEELDGLIKSVFYDMFGDPVTNDKGWQTVKIGSILNVETGSTPSRNKKEYYEYATIPWVKTGEIEQGYIYNTEERITQVAIEETNCKILPENTILIAMYGQGKTRGKSGILKISAATNQACAALLPSNGIDTEYLFRLLRVNYDNLRSLGRGGNQENLNLSIIKDYTIVLPPISLQNQFASIVTKIEEQKSLVKQSIQETQQLFDSLMSQYFD
ncbi:type I restriction enzyme, S subunit [Paenibacillus sp. cl6col]|uniref:Restriction endonuclease subunit S n=1 Tax=Paenibacillus alvei TaxID=44250 RepID=A0ABT4EED9_PAEAL|nr:MULTISPECIES: restriction endonuclease subunit S [Paenibacillus]MCY9532102.1 restriction endonuclease subunit S [Paenibacillus alvei]SDE52996.1 type I restriction enzyme, S subunit [Paenibacillus sp. cl6col]